ncbi:hypothetical protein T12_3400 [Trichinella patagoniensis]|uniref:Uncharacterized protein n=1 Tax=Trichinella patagoniensis TaxID=990121 RepID=A0A0V0ZAC3_9BILA|nr:hypothetical protein T12_3400 [Trichinella patagoniensis]
MNLHSTYSTGRDCRIITFMKDKELAIGTLIKIFPTNFCEPGRGGRLPAGWNGWQSLISISSIDTGGRTRTRTRCPDASASSAD